RDQTISTATPLVSKHSANSLFNFDCYLKRLDWLGLVFSSQSFVNLFHGSPLVVSAGKILSDNDKTEEIGSLSSRKLPSHSQILGCAQEGLL
ncbi:MAG: hypothetical protein WB769_03025, partial [Pseudolabrys sp.]